MSTNPAVLSEGSFFVPDLEASLRATLDRLDRSQSADLLAAGFTLRDLVRFVATTSPFNEVLTKRVQEHVLGNS